MKGQLTWGAAGARQDSAGMLYLDGDPVGTVHTQDLAKDICESEGVNQEIIKRLTEGRDQVKGFLDKACDDRDEARRDATAAWSHAADAHAARNQALAGLEAMRNRADGLEMDLEAKTRALDSVILERNAAWADKRDICADVDKYKALAKELQAAVEENCETLKAYRRENDRLQSKLRNEVCTRRMVVAERGDAWVEVNRQKGLVSARDATINNLFSKCANARTEATMLRARLGSREEYQAALAEQRTELRALVERLCPGLGDAPEATVKYVHDSTNDILGGIAAALLKSSREAIKASERIREDIEASEEG